jgi:hypothetical protein
MNRVGGVMVNVLAPTRSWIQAPIVSNHRLYEKFEDTKRVIRSRKSKDSQYNVQTTIYKYALN